MRDLTEVFAEGDEVVADTSNGLRYGIVTAVGAMWLEVDGQIVASHSAALWRRV